MSSGWVDFDDVQVSPTVTTSTKYYYARGQRVAMRVGTVPIQYTFGDNLGSTILVTDNNFNTVTNMRYNAWTVAACPELSLSRVHAKVVNEVIKGKSLG